MQHLHGRADATDLGSHLCGRTERLGDNRNVRPHWQVVAILNDDELWVARQPVGYAERWKVDPGGESEVVRSFLATGACGQGERSTRVFGGDRQSNFSGTARGAGVACCAKPDWA